MTVIVLPVYVVTCSTDIYRSRVLLGACAYNSTGRKYAPISEMRLIMNDIKCASIRTAYGIAFSTPYRIENGRVSRGRLQRLTASTWDES